MTSKKTLQDTVTHELRTSPFEQIADLETKQETRVQEAVEQLNIERIDAEKGITDAEKHAEEKMRDDATKHLAECKEEMGKEMEANEATIKEDLKAIDAFYKKNAPVLIEEQAKAILFLAI